MGNSIADIINGTSSASGAANGTKRKDQLGQDAFLQLMVAQLRNQDPFKAQDPSQFLGQLAQFSTVTGIQEMETSFATLSDSMRSSQVLDGATMVGREVLVASETGQLGAEGAVRGAVEVPSGATAVTMTIRDSAGQLVRRMNVPPTEGLNDFSWDGTTDTGTRAPAGTYSFDISANAGGKNVSLETLVSGRVSSVTIDASQGLQLNTAGLGVRSLSEVRRVV
jgi:flagellar basal-body rod modification protein FlgD